MALYNIITSNFAFGGYCVGKNSGKTVFVPFSLPDEELEVEITESKKDYDVARIVNILKPSPYRVTPVCPLYGKCGGCNMMHIENNYQIELKKQVLRELFEKNKVKIPEIEVISGNPLGYRNRFQFHDGGLEKKGSNEIVFPDFCPVASQEINDYLKSTPASERPEGRCQYFGAKNASPSMSVALPIEKRRAQTPYKALSKKEKKNRGKHYIKPRFEGINDSDQCRITCDIKGRKIAFDARGFFQSNLEVLKKTIDAVTAGLSGKNALDMYSGAGTFSVFLSDSFEKVTMVEHNRGAMVFAEENMAGRPHESYGISGAQWVKSNAAGIIAQNGNFDAIVIDPPRSGMEKEVREWISQSRVPVIRAVSCDPATQARDMSMLSDYQIEKLFLLDFYPQTSHIETLLYCIHKDTL